MQRILPYVFVVLCVLNVQFLEASYQAPEMLSSLNSRCWQSQSRFVLNPSNIHTLIAITCGALSHVENERKNLQYSDSATMVHQWHVTGSGNMYKAEGYCAIPLQNLKNQNIEKYKINLTFQKTAEGEILTRGSVASKGLHLNWSNNEFLDPTCVNPEQYFNRLDHINIGLGISIQDMLNFLKSGRSGAILTALEHEKWDASSGRNGFADSALQYKLSLPSGLNFALLAAKNASAIELQMRTINLLYYAEGAAIAQFKTDSAGRPLGFYDTDGPINHRFRSYIGQGGSQVVGCTSLIYESVLALPEDLDYRLCSKKIENSVLKQKRLFPISAQLPTYNLEPTPRQIEQAQLKKLQQLVAQKYGRAQRYSRVPNLFEQNKVPWSRADIQRGYVTFERSMVKTPEGYEVIDYRYNIKGDEFVERYRLQI